jgi:hypothetical protein
MLGLDKLKYFLKTLPHSNKVDVWKTVEKQSLKRNATTTKFNEFFLVLNGCGGNEKFKTV